MKETIDTLVESEAKAVYPRIANYLKRVNEELIGVDFILIDTERIINEFSEKAKYVMKIRTGNDEITYGTNKTTIICGDNTKENYEIATKIARKIVFTIGMTSKNIDVYYNNGLIKRT